jgi:succinate dehydrogenase/fumarate reductase flavoprotein subunit
MSSGAWAGQGAADYAKQAGPAARGLAARAGTAALRERAGRPFAPTELARAVQDEVFPYELNYFREAGRLGGSLQRLDALWAEVSSADAATEADVLRAREATAMLATARWMYRGGLARNESRGMHRRDDFPGQDERFRRYITTGGLDEVWTSSRPHAGASYAEAAE